MIEPVLQQPKRRPVSMRFVRRRSSLTAESVQSEPESRRRNRLSKPQTVNAAKVQLSTSTSALNLQVPYQSSNASSTDLAPPSPQSPVSPNALRLQIRNEVLGSNTDNHSPLYTTKNDSSWSVAHMVGRLEGKDIEAEAPPMQLEIQEPIPVSPIRSIKRKSILRRISMQRSPSLIRTPSSERIGSLLSEGTASTTSESLDQIVESPSIPPTRRSSFTPGAATRKLHAVTSEQDMHANGVIEELEEPEANIIETEHHGWEPPQPRTSGRAGTPSDMGYSQLGGLRHGSLQVVNGRASPTFSETSKISRYLLAVQAPNRDVSSEYGDAEEDFEADDELIMSTYAHDRADRRFVSWNKDDDRSAPQIHPLHNVMSPHEENEAASDKDHTSIMANEYIAELDDSPYDQQRPESPVGTLRRTRSEGSLWRASSCSSLQSTGEVPRDLRELSPVSLLGASLSPSGSVVRHRMEAKLEGPAFLQVVTLDDHRPVESVVSWHSPVEPSAPIDEAFQSAVDLQVQLSHVRVGDQLPRAAGNPDSGYSSSNSLRSKTTPPPVEFEALPELTDSVTTASTPQSSRPASFLGLRPSILKSRKTQPNIPTFASVPYSATSSMTAPIRTKMTATELKIASEVETEANAAKTTKTQKKLVKKRRPLSQLPSQVSVMTVQPFEKSSIPDVSPEARENLHLKSFAVPELEQTQMLSGVLANQHSNNSNIDFSKIDLRFPSPEPEDPKRSRSRSRPRSWFGRSKTDIPSPRYDSGISQADAMAIINDFGTDGAVLGRNNYDLSHSGIVSPRSRASSIVSTPPPQPRTMMDDETATKLARRRSRSIQERNAMALDVRPSFNDRGGVPGKKYRPASIISEVPPITAEMLEKAYRSSSIQRFPSMNTTATPPPPAHESRPVILVRDQTRDKAMALPPPPSRAPPPPPVHSPRPTKLALEEPKFEPTAPPPAPCHSPHRSNLAHEEDRAEAIAPPPPSHSPRPANLGRYYSREEAMVPPPPFHSPHPRYVSDEEAQTVEIAPPPPSHSPRPVDVTADPWAAQAEAWKARRKSAGEVLRRQSWDPRKHAEHLETIGNEPLYPVIPPRPQPGWMQCISPEQYSAPSNGFHQQDVHATHQRTQSSLSAKPSNQRNLHQSTYVSQSRKNSMVHDTEYTSNPSRDSSRLRPLPSPRPSAGVVSSRPHSNANSKRSSGTSMIEERREKSQPPPAKRPQFDANNGRGFGASQAEQRREKSQPPPTSGRYSGGLAFGYERGSGVGGSAGTKSSSSKVDATRKGVGLRASHGVDLGDVPVGIMV